MIQGYALLMAYMLPSILIIYTILSLFIQKRIYGVFVIFGFFPAWILSAEIALLLSKKGTATSAENEIYLASFVGSVIIIVSLALFGKKKQTRGIKDNTDIPVVQNINSVEKEEKNNNEMIFCKNCENKIKSTDKFCQHCGKETSKIEIKIPSGYPALAKHLIQQLYRGNANYIDVKNEVKSKYGVDLPEEDYIAIGESSNLNVPSTEKEGSKISKNVRSIIVIIIAIGIGKYVGNYMFSDKNIPHLKIENTEKTRQSIYTTTDKATISTPELNFNQSSIKGLSQAHGFLIGQELALARIEEKYTDLAPAVYLARAKFNASFPNIIPKFKQQLSSALGAEKLEKLDAKLKKQLLSYSKKNIITRDIANKYLNEINKRAEGKIESPIGEYILSVNYASSPVSEFYDGYRQKFNSKKHPKARGLNVTLQIPKSWKAEEDGRPHIVQKWTNQNGTGLNMIHLLIQDANSDIPTEKEIEFFISSGAVRNIVHNGASYINSGVFSTEKQKGYWVEMTDLKDRVGEKIYQHIKTYQFFFQNKIISLSCSSGGNKDDKKRSDEKFTRIEPLCHQVMNSLVLIDAYESKKP